MNYKNQLLVYLVGSIVIGSLVNTIRTDGVPWLAKPIDLLINTEDAISVLSEPSIREIDLDLARSLHRDGILFLDARAEEYLADGMIPGAIANDEVELVAAQIEYLIGMEKAFIIYCSDDDCGSSEELAYELQDMGFNNILVFKGGWKTWTDAGLEIEKDE